MAPPQRSAAAAAGQPLPLPSPPLGRPSAPNFTPTPPPLHPRRDPPLLAAPAKGDPVIAYSPLYGHENITDSAWHDDTAAFQEYGPITAIEVFKSERWHDPYVVRLARAWGGGGAAAVLRRPPGGGGRLQTRAACGRQPSTAAALPSQTPTGRGLDTPLTARTCRQPPKPVM
jgi:hypothetical protein